MVISIVALFVAISGTAIALPGTNSVNSGDIINRQVKTKDLHGSAVNTGKIENGQVRRADLRDGAVDSTKVDASILTADTVGVPIAGANIDADGTVRRFFNRVGGTPTVSHTAASGQYDLTFPGLEGQVLNSGSVSLATIQSSGFGDVATISSSGGNPRIRTANAAGAAADRAFEYVIFQRSP